MPLEPKKNQTFSNYVNFLLIFAFCLAFCNRLGLTDVTLIAFARHRECMEDKKMSF